MSRARAKKDRIPDDVYSTPGALALAICRDLKERHIDPVEVIEPSAGYGWFVRAIRETWPEALLLAADIHDRSRVCLAAGASVFVKEPWESLAVRVAAQPRPPGAGTMLICGNPPFSIAQAHVEAALAAMHPGDVLAFLMRVGFLGADERIEFWRRHPAKAVLVVVPRPSFTFGGSDGSEYAVFIWQKGWTGHTALGFLTREKGWDEP